MTPRPGTGPRAGMQLLRLPHPHPTALLEVTQNYRTPRGPAGDETLG